MDSSDFRIIYLFTDLLAPLIVGYLLYRRGMISDDLIRRILRRAVRYGYTFLGRREAFMYSLLPVLIETMGDAYPELIAGRELIAKVMREEEESFLRTLETGIRLLDKQIEEAKKAGKTVLDGHDASSSMIPTASPLT